MSEPGYLFTEEEADILQEVMNIAFGKASAELAEVIDITVILSVPEIRLFRGEKLHCYLIDQMRFAERLSLVEQGFIGRFRGSALLGFPQGAEECILRLMGEEELGEDVAEGPSSLGCEALLEVGNILIGACIGKLSELLKDYVTYTPPRLLVEDYHALVDGGLLARADDVGITMKTMFSFEEAESVTGYLFLLTDESSLSWLKQALNDYLDSFG